MPVYNAEKHVSNAIKSILTQSFKEFEFLIIDDGSSDNTTSIIRSYNDSRIRLIYNQENLGIAATLNKGIELSNSEYIVRMDADDISRFKRIKKQVDFMDSNPAVGVSGTWIRLFGNQPPIVIRRPVGPEIVRSYGLFDNPLTHPSTIMRRHSLVHNHLKYDPNYNKSEDYELWTRCTKYFHLDNLPEPLVLMRHHNDSVTSKSKTMMKIQTEAILKKELNKIDINPTEDELSFHHLVGRSYRQADKTKIEQAHTWLLYIQGQNEKKNVYDPNALSIALGMIWFQICANSAQLGNRVWSMYRNSILRKKYAPPVQEVIRFWLSIFWNYLLRMTQNKEGAFPSINRRNTK